MHTISDQDIYLFREGTQASLYRFLGCRLQDADAGARFAVWAPNATAISVIGDWNGWDGAAHPLAARSDGSGVWEGEVPGVRMGHAYKYRIICRDGRVLE